MLLVLNLLRAVLAGIRRLYGALLSCLGFLSHQGIVIPLEFKLVDLIITKVQNLRSGF